jgi:hypothetical protein
LSFLLPESMVAGVIHVAVARLGIDGEHLVHKFYRPDRGGILLVKLHRVDKNAFAHGPSSRRA